MSEATELLDSLAKQGVVLWGEGSRLRFRASKGTLTEAMRSQLTSHKDSVLAAWRERAGQSVVSHPAAHGQRALWFLHQSNPGSAAYNVVFSARVRSAIDLPALRRSFQALVDRHPSLRTTFCEESDCLVQQVHGYMPVCFTVHDRTGIDLPIAPKTSSGRLPDSVRPAKRPADASRSFHAGGGRSYPSFDRPPYRGGWLVTLPAAGRFAANLSGGAGGRRATPAASGVRHSRTFAMAGGDAGRSRRSGARGLLVEQAGGHSYSA